MDFGLLLIIIFIVAPLLEKLLGAGRQGPGQQPPVPPGRRPQQGRVPPSQRPGLPGDDDETPFRSVPASHDEHESAAGVLPDDLWEILTGERRAPRPDAPPPARREPVAGPDAGEAGQPRQQPAAPARREGRAEARPASGPEVRPLPTRSREREVVLRDRSPRSRERPVELRDRTPRERDPDRIRPGASDPELREPVPAVPVRAARMAALAEDDEIRLAEERHRRFRERMDRDRASAAAAPAPGPSVYRFNDVADLRRAVVMAEVLGPPKSLEP